MLLTIPSVLLCFAASSARAEDSSQSSAIQFGPPIVQRWQIGYVVTAQGGAVDGITAYCTVPMDWPEQRVKVVSEDISSSVKSLRYRTIGGGAKQMIISIPRLRPNETATALVTFEIEKLPIEAPKETNDLRAPIRTSGALKAYLTPGPAIESQHREIQALAKELAADDRPAWEQVGADFDWVRANVEYKFDEQLRGALAALHAKEGDCEELTALFVAICRGQGIPARSVWVPGHCYPEFYLEDANGQGHWFPCQAAGEARDFGRMPESRPILQKGDNFKLPGEREPQHYVHEKFEAKNASAAPKVEFVRKLVE